MTPVRIVVRGTSGRLRSATSFGVSGTIHAALLSWLMLAAAVQQREAPKNIYDQEIRPYEKHIVWYTLRDKLPNVTPAEARSDNRTPRARLKFNQSIVAGEKDDARPPQVIRMPAPPIELSKPLQLPNMLAVAVPRTVRSFTPPPIPPTSEKPSLLLPEAPSLSTELKPMEVEVASAATKPVRAFTSPASERSPAKPAATLPDAPNLRTESQVKPIELAGAAVRPVRPFSAPEAPATPKTPIPAVALPEAPRLTPASAASVTLPVAVPVAGPRRAFTLPAGQPRAPAPVASLPDAPQLASGSSAPAEMPRIPRAFTPPPARQAAMMAGADGEGSASALPPPPQFAAGTSVLPGMPRIPRSFTAPPAPSARAGAIGGGDAAASSALPEAPGLAGATPTPGATASLAIVGLNPANTTAIPSPPGSHEAGFSAGPKPKADGSGPVGNKSASIVIPGLLTQGGANDDHPTLVSVLAPPTSHENLVAALHVNPPPVRPPGNSELRATRVDSAPDPRLYGRLIYTLAIQMPNVTSFSGSWIVWFAEHDPASGAPPRDMRPPIATRKVDPKYIQAAADERVEGTVRLSAIVRKSGRVEHIELLQHLDERLDRSAAEALGKWEFEPAARDGAPIDIDAVFEIPFHLAPKLKK